MPAKKRLPPSQTSLAPPKPAAPPERLLYCSFCGCDQMVVSKMIAGQRKAGDVVCICDHCVLLCLDILIEEEGARRDERIREQRKRRKNGKEPRDGEMSEDS